MTDSPPSIFVPSSGSTPGAPPEVHSPSSDGGAGIAVTGATPAGANLILWPTGTLEEGRARFTSSGTDDAVGYPWAALFWDPDEDHWVYSYSPDISGANDVQWIAEHAATDPLDATGWVAGSGGGGAIAFSPGGASGRPPAVFAPGAQTTAPGSMIISGTLTTVGGAPIATPKRLLYAGISGGKSKWSLTGNLADVNDVLYWSSTSMPFPKWILAMTGFEKSSTTDTASPEGLVFSGGIGSGTPVITKQAVSPPPAIHTP